MPSYLRDWLRGIVAAGERTTGGVVVWKAPRENDDALVILRLRDWQGLARRRVGVSAVQHKPPE